MNDSHIHLGTSGFTAAGWSGSFYPSGLKSSDYLQFYAEHFDTVEIDSTFYGCPTARTVSHWELKTPQGFVFSVKVPQTITHEKVLLDCQGELREFVDTMKLLGHKLGPMVFQFPYFDKGQIKDRHEFTDRLIPVLKKLPADCKFAIEIRNKDWMDAEFAGLLRTFGVALVLQDLSYMPTAMALKFDPITADFTYIRWLGDRKEIERQTLRWDKAIIDRTHEISEWVKYCYPVVRRGVRVFGYANNHYSGHAPDSVEQFRRLWTAGGGGELGRPAQPPRVKPAPAPQSQGRLLFD